MLVNGTQDYYTDNYFESLNKITDQKNNFQRYRLSAVMKMVNPTFKDKILDVGTGLGSFAFACIQVSNYVIGLDFSPKAIELCKQKSKRLGFKGSLKFIQGDATQMPFKDKTFTKVICADLSEHLYPKDHIKLFNEIHRVLCNKGNLTLFTPNKKHYIERLRKLGIIPPMREHVGVESMDHYLNILKTCGYEIISIGYYPTHYPLISHIEDLFIRNNIASAFFGKRICIIAERP